MSLIHNTIKLLKLTVPVNHHGGFLAVWYISITHDAISEELCALVYPHRIDVLSSASFRSTCCKQVKEDISNNKLCRTKEDKYNS